ncbi:MAG: hypothetical protein M1517_05025 [Deltaproteobacteria bacterium]|nr:hypothetical protein [Deltaproteobacteria bacterium]
MKSNKRTMFGIAVVMAALSGLIVGGCGPSKSGGPSVQQLIQDGSNALIAKNPTAAKASFQKVLNTDTNNCGGEWGMVLSDLQDATVNQIPNLPANLVSGVLADNLASIFTGVSTDLADMPARTAVIEAKGCEFTLTHLPIDIKPDFSSLTNELSSLGVSLPLNLNINYSFDLGTQWGPAEARILGTTANSLLAFINILGAHQLDVTDIMSNLSTLENLLKGGLSLSDPIKLIRSLGPVFQALPKLLTFNNSGTGSDDIKAAGSEINTALSEISGINDSLQLDKGNAAKVISYDDVNGNGVADAGDTFTFGVLDLTPTTGPINILQEYTGSETFTVPAYPGYAGKYGNFNVSSNTIPAAKVLLEKFINNLTNGSPNIVPMDVNDLLTAIGFTGYTFTTSVISLNPSSIFANPVPLRSFFPTLATNGEFQVEAEVGAVLSTTAWYYEAGDASHFTDTTKSGISITPDGISVPTTAADLFSGSLMGTALTIPAMLPYISFGDPTFDGVLSIDLSQLLEFCEGGSPCPVSPATGFKAATSYSLNKIIAGGVYGLFTDTTSSPVGQHFTTEDPIW